MLPLLFVLLPIFSYADKTSTAPNCAGPIAGIREIVHLGEIYFKTGGQRGPFRVEWQNYIGQTVDVQVENKSNVEKSSQRILAVGGSDVDTLPTTLVAAIRSDATFLVPTGKPLQSDIMFNDVIVYAAEWGGQWHRTKPISVNEHDIELLNKIHSAELEKFLNEALDQKITRLAVIGVSENNLPIGRDTSIMPPASQLGAILSLPVVGYFIPWRPASQGQDFLFYKVD